MIFSDFQKKTKHKLGIHGDTIQLRITNPQSLSFDSQSPKAVVDGSWALPPFAQALMTPL